MISPSDPPATQCHPLLPPPSSPSILFESAPTYCASHHKSEQGLTIVTHVLREGGKFIAKIFCGKDTTHTSLLYC
ncbi:hypothetical protein ACB092_10G106200 [Castanea dentata]